MHEGYYIKVLYVIVLQKEQLLF